MLVGRSRQRRGRSASLLLGVLGFALLRALLALALTLRFLRRGEDLSELLLLLGAQGARDVGLIAFLEAGELLLVGLDAGLSGLVVRLVVVAECGARLRHVLVHSPEISFVASDRRDDTVGFRSGEAVVLHHLG